METNLDGAYTIMYRVPSSSGGSISVKGLDDKSRHAKDGLVSPRGSNLDLRTLKLSDVFGQWKIKKMGPSGSLGLQSGFRRAII